MTNKILYFFFATLWMGCSSSPEQVKTAIYPNKILLRGDSPMKEVGKLFDGDTTTHQTFTLKDSLRIQFDPIKISQLELVMNNGDQSSKSSFSYRPSIKKVKLILNDNLVREATLTHTSTPQLFFEEEFADLELRKISFSFEEFQLEGNAQRDKSLAYISEIRIKVKSADTQSNARLPLAYVPKLFGKVSQTETLALDEWATTGENALPLEALKEHLPITTLSEDPDELLEIFPETPMTEEWADEWSDLLNDMDDIVAAETCVEVQKHPFENGLKGGRINYTALDQCPEAPTSEMIQALIADSVPKAPLYGPYHLTAWGKNGSLALYGEKRYSESIDGVRSLIKEKLLCRLDKNGLLRTQIMVRRSLSLPSQEKEDLHTLEMYGFEYEGNFIFKSHKWSMEFGHDVAQNKYYIARKYTVRLTQ